MENWRKLTSVFISIILFSLLLTACQKGIDRSTSPPVITASVPGGTVPGTTTPRLTDYGLVYPSGYTYIDYTGGNVSSPRPDGFGLDKLVWGPFSIHLFGSAGFTGEAVFNMQLYSDNESVDWWPVKYGVRAIDGKWEIGLKAGEDVPSRAAHALEEFPAFENGYSLRIWKAQYPEVQTDLSLDSPGPWSEKIIPPSENKFLKKPGESKWKLSSINGAALVDGTEITLEFGDDWATGMADCNHYGGQYVLKDPDLLSVYEIITTALSCGKVSDKQSEEYLHCLNDAVCYRIIGAHLVLYDVITHKATLVFERQ